MMHFLYNLGIFLYATLIRIASLFNTKAKRWTEGRKDVFEKLTQWREKNPDKVVWMHCASLGEFEQGRPLLEKIKLNYPEYKIILSFFSPSGYEVRKNYSGADLILYLPEDTPVKSKRWINILSPSMVFFVKYEIWANYFFELKRNKIPLYLISGIFRPNHRFFGAQRIFWKRVLECVTHFHLQNEESEKLLHEIGILRTTVSGDTRYDRVLEIAAEAKTIDKVDQFINGRICLVVGSSYALEEKVAFQCLGNAENSCAIIAPHYIDEPRLKEIEARFGSECVRFSVYDGTGQAKVLLIDNIGLLSALYQYADIAVVGGGFGKGIHNTLEPAVYGIPVFFGPNYKKFAEAVALVQAGGAMACDNLEVMEREILQCIESREARERMGKIAGEAVKKGGGALGAILESLDFQGK